MPCDIRVPRPVLPRAATLCAAVLLASCLDVANPNPGPPDVYLAVPDGWTANFGNAAGVGLSKIHARTGTTAAYLSGQASSPVQATLVQLVKSDLYLAKRVRLSAWVKPQNIVGTLAGIWMRVDGAEHTVAFDNMSTRPVLGTGDWRQVSIVLDVPANALGIAFGALFNGQGTLLLDDVTIEIVPTTEPVTNLLTEPTPINPALVAEAYTAALPEPVNLGFEGLPAVSDTTIAWLTSHTNALSTTDPVAPLTDLVPLTPMIGSAHVVGLGESTHGTSEFQRAKHRMFRFLVQQHGFTHLAVEGSASDAAAINHYVLTGEGDPAKLLSGMRFWIVNTQEVRDLITWMREWNATAPPERRVQFAGFDFQQPGGAMDSVEAFIARVDPAQSDYVRVRMACFDPFVSRGATFGAPMQIYNARLETSRAECALGLREVHQLFVAQASLYRAASSDSAFINALHHVRLVQQWESMATNFSLANTFRSNVSRDSSMAENVMWIRERAGPDAKMVVWAHNDHVGRMPNTMGRHLGREYGSDYVAMAFTFGDGVFNAVNASSGVLDPFRPAPVPATWMEHTLSQTGKPLLLFDARQLASGGAAAAALRNFVTMRSVGSTYNASSMTAFSRRYQLPSYFDLLYYVQTARETTLLPFVF